MTAIAGNTSIPLTTKGDLITRTSTTTLRLGVGTNDKVLTADSTAAEGIAWKDLSAIVPDFHSGYYYIGAAQTVTISEFKQMANFGGLVIDGTLNIEGQLRLEL